ncbi:MAG: TetR/AcrR family transcriptional regulator [Firmicutes bacterium]|nr:TetR/AcrR family transcriptional regulator [Bacillota bacterium]
MARSPSRTLGGGPWPVERPSRDARSARHSTHPARTPARALAERPAGAEKLDHILRHAARVFSEKGYAGASMRDISRSSGVPLAGLYYYCESKQKLLYLIQIWAFRSILDRLEQRLSGVAEPVERLHVFVQNHLEYFLSHPVEMKVLTHEEKALTEPLRREVAEIKRRYYALAREIFDELRRSEGIRGIQPRIAVLSLFGMMNWIYTWYNPRVDPSAERLAEIMTGIFLEGVRNGHGHRIGWREPSRSHPQAAGRLAG